MKTFYIFITLLIMEKTFSQSPILPLNASANQITNGAYLKDTQNQLPPFVGTWVYQQGNKKITLKFQKIMYHVDWSYPTYYVDILEANYKVEEETSIIYNNLNNPFDGTSDISGHFFKNDNYLISFVDNIKCEIGGDAQIWIDSSGKMHWEMNISNPNPNYDLGDCPESDNPSFYDSMTLPWNMILTKQP